MYDGFFVIYWIVLLGSPVSLLEREKNVIMYVKIKLKKWKDELCNILYSSYFISSAIADVCDLSLQAEQLMKRIGVEGVKLTEYEMNIASHLVDPQTMKVILLILSPCYWYFWALTRINYFDIYFQTGFFTVVSHPAGVLERYRRSGWNHKWATRHGHPAFSEETSFSWIQTFSAS